ncbi:conserved hypothetical protein [Segniliparus rotundus DSM 44985]|uniref:Pyrrolo-quinoline quinone n=1 Tax=Segniliparus rotundus (strain ATCC BAA-972 / CDC 1076 / CIP 108378 / DSM 44985 / JCM 13578) TaxID=640132 RepID=D6ZAF7_SEGRD|nr:PQQ-binding-like beta-propeller repeat protein [Segniliparus rotundus]ADG96699.1 conserved hypothetical protein [Segniliparus rotundus DSM 44985]
MRRPVFWRDCLIAFSIALTVLAAGAVLWLRAPTRQVVAQTAARAAPSPQNAAVVPESFELAWSKSDSAASSPMVFGGTLVVADAHALTGWEIATGRQAWRFAEPMPLCAATSAWGKVFAVYRGPDGCSLVVALEAATGKRPTGLHEDTRTGNGALFRHIRLAPTVLSQGSEGGGPGSGTGAWAPHMILALGPRHLELWHENLLRSVEYGHVTTPFEPNKQPHPGCALRSAVVGEDSFAVLERCRRDSALLLSFLKNSPKKDTEPEKACPKEQTCSAVLDTLQPGDDAELLGVVDERAALYVPATQDHPAQIAEVGMHGEVVRSTDLNTPVTEHQTPPWRTSPALITWWTGAAVVGLSAESLAVVFQTPGLVGPATEMGGQLIAPTADGLAVLDPATGARLRDIPMQGANAGGKGGVSLAVSGSSVIRQQGGKVLVYSGR